MKYFYVVYGFSKSGISGQGSFYSKSANGNVYPQELSKWIREQNGYDSAVILNWIEIPKEVHEKSVEELQ